MTRPDLNQTRTTPEPHQNPDQTQSATSSFFLDGCGYPGCELTWEKAPKQPALVVYPGNGEVPIGSEETWDKPWEIAAQVHSDAVAAGFGKVRENMGCHEQH